MSTSLSSKFQSSFQTKLLAWYRANKRDLPFRKTKDPYCIWLSEIMAQQTTMSAVIGYYTKFIARFPTLRHVADADEQELLRYWQGLGYYSRIRNFRSACQSILTDHNATIPKSSNQLQKLKGIGSYTAAAIASICFDEAVAVIDGNVKRVLCRIFAYAAPTETREAKTFFDARSAQLLAKNTPGDFNQAMMELGALICTPKGPKCSSCPVASLCLSKDNNPERLPLKKIQNFIEVTYASAIITDHKTVLLKKPASTNLIKNMWELPSSFNVPSSKAIIQLLETCQFALPCSKFKPTGQVKHAITNKKITNLIYIYEAKSPELTKLDRNDFKRISLDSLDEIPLNTLSRKILKAYFTSRHSIGHVKEVYP